MEKIISKKKKFEMPHLFWIMIGLMLIASIATYVIPTGKFSVDSNTGKILGNEFKYLGIQTPVGIYKTLMLILQGLIDSGVIIWVVLTSGAMTAVVMATGAFDEILNWSIFKLKDKNQNIIVCVMFVLMTYLGGFGGTDALIAVVPIGVIFSRKLGLDPICAIGVSTYATLLGFGTGPTKQATTELLMNVPVYGSFFTMFLSMNLFMLIGLGFLLRYIKKIKKDPTKSPMYSLGWRPSTEVADDSSIKEVHLSKRTIAILTIFMLQYALIVAFPFIGGSGSQLFPFMVLTSVVTAILAGIIAKFSFNRIGDEFAKGLSGLAFIGLVIGLARVISLILIQGQIIDTIVYVLTRPIINAPRSIASIGMTAVISVVNILIPSGSSKAAILVPIIQPVSEALDMLPQLAVQAFQYGDGFTNLFSPFLGWTVGSCVMAGVPFEKWFKWVLPKAICFIIISFGAMWILTEFGWTPF